MSNDTLTFSGSHSYSLNGVRRMTGFSFDADLNQLVAHGAGGLFITYKAKCKDILYQGLPQVRVGPKTRGVMAGLSARPICLERLQFTYICYCVVPSIFPVLSDRLYSLFLHFPHLSFTCLFFLLLNSPYFYFPLLTFTYLFFLLLFSF